MEKASNENYLASLYPFSLFPIPIPWYWWRPPMAPKCRSTRSCPYTNQDYNLHHIPSTNIAPPIQEHNRDGQRIPFYTINSKLWTIWKCHWNDPREIVWRHMLTVRLGSQATRKETDKKPCLYHKFKSLDDPAKGWPSTPFTHTANLVWSVRH
jgi:hypothetical protein